MKLKRRQGTTNWKIWGIFRSDIFKFSWSFGYTYSLFSMHFDEISVS